MKIKTSELTGAALDWAVGYIMGEKLRILDRQIVWPEDYSPSTNWAQGGPIIEREGINIIQSGSWFAEMDADHSGGVIHAEGDTPLIAAMRCFVAAKWNDEVEIPEELK